MADDARKVAFYGKGGIGKSTTASNVSAAISYMDHKVLQVGCDPKRDSIATLCGKLMPTILDQVKASPRMSANLMDQVVFTGYNGVLGMESGGPSPGTGCAGKGVFMALQMIEQFQVIKRYGVTFVIFDVLGDVVCGGFAQPMRGGFAREIYLVTCGELLTLFQVNNIARAVAKLHGAGADVGIAGLINNMREVANEEAIVEAFAREIGVPVIQHVPRSRLVQQAENQGKTVIEAFPHSPQSDVYRELAVKILDNKSKFVPGTITMRQIKEIVHSFDSGKQQTAAA